MGNTKSRKDRRKWEQRKKRFIREEKKRKDKGKKVERITLAKTFQTSVVAPPRTDFLESDGRRRKDKPKVQIR